MDIASYFRFVIALLFVLGLIGLFALLAKRYGLGLPRAINRGAKGRRLALVEVMALDPKRKLVIIRRDEVEHLVILGPGSETVVETDIAPPPEMETEMDFKDSLINGAQSPEAQP